MKLLRSTKSEITKDENGKNVSHFEITEVVSVHCNIVNNDYQHDSRVLLDICPKIFICLKTFNSEFPCIEVWFTGQNSKLLEINISITLVINLSVKYKKWFAIQLNLEIKYL